MGKGTPGGLASSLRQALFLNRCRRFQLPRPILVEEFSIHEQRCSHKGEGGLATQAVGVVSWRPSPWNMRSPSGVCAAWSSLSRPWVQPGEEDMSPGICVIDSKLCIAICLVHAGPGDPESDKAFNCEEETNE